LRGDRGAAGLAIGALLWLGSALPAEAQGGGLYRYVDSRGVVHFTNRPPDSRYQRVSLPRGLIRYGPSQPAAAPRTFDALILEASTVHGIPPALVKAVIHAESAFDPRAISAKGAMGLMQLMPGTARELGVSQPFHVEQNVHGGTRYLRALHDRYGSWTTALAAYNAGPGAVDRYAGIPPFAETREYVRRVLSYYRRYHGDFAR
jgi:soluble lytic murein transglycosylase-like protein